MAAEIADSISPGAQLIVAVLLAIGSFTGFGAILLVVVKWLLRRHDASSTVHATNEGKAIDADVNAFNRISDRLEKLEDRFDDLNDKYTKLMADHATIKTNNEHLQRENTRLEGELQTARGRINDLERELADLKLELEKLKGK